MNATKHLLLRPLNCQKHSTVCSQLSLTRHLIKADTSKVDTWSWSLPYFSHLLHLPSRWTPLQDGQSELVPSMSALEGVDCASIIQDCSCCIHTCGLSMKFCIESVVCQLMPYQQPNKDVIWPFF